MQPVNKLILGDNLEILKTFPDECIDLIYIDPPFFSNRNYEVIWGDEGEIRSFQDRWSGGMDHYIGWLKERIEQMYRILKSSGSMFVHCDWHANAYIRTEILDRMFGFENFRNEIVWQRTTTHNDAKQGAKHFGRIYDTIFFYSKSLNQFAFNTVYQAYNDKYISQSYNKVDTNGRRFKTSDLSAAKGGGDTSFEWKGIGPPKGRFWAYSKENFAKFEKEDRIYYSNTGTPYLKQFLDEMPGKSTDDLWTDILLNKIERIGYPTQKPEALLERIIKCASNEGDTIMDCFVGGGTTCAVADKLERNWIGIDQSVQAIKVTELRLNKQQDLFSKPFIVQLHKYDYDTLRYQNAFEFESWIIQQFGGISNMKQRNDFGLDGKALDGSPIQVKRSDSIGRNVIDNFRSAVERADKRLFENNVTEGKPVGYIIAFSFNRGAIEEVARLKNKDNVIIRLVTVEEIVPVSKKPTLSIEVVDAGRDAKDHRQIEFVASAESAAGIEFFSWDFDYRPEAGFKPTIIIDKDGRQTHRFKPGQHQIAVKVFDNDGLENLEVIKLKVNGELERS